VAIQHLVIAGLSAITLNVFFEPAHLGRLKFFDFVRIKREDLFEVVVINNNESRNARSKTKIRGYPKGTVQPARQVLCLFLACSRKMVAKTLGFVK
jgi:hypothetical protein